MLTTASLHLLPPPHPAASSLRPSPALLSFKFNPIPSPLLTFRVRAGDFDDIEPAAEFINEEVDVDDVDNEPDYDPDYEPLTGDAAGDLDLALQGSELFNMKGWDAETVVDYRINEEEFHKISLLDCDFFIRKPPDPDNDVYDFSEMYVTPPDTDVYSIPKILAPMPQKLIRCAASDFLSHKYTEPPIDSVRDPLYKTEEEIFKVFLIKHYGNRRMADPDFVLDFEEIYVIDSKTKSITRAKVLVTAPGGKNRDRKDDMLIVGDNGTSFKIIHRSEKPEPIEVIEREEWDTSKQGLYKFLRKLHDFDRSNFF